MSSHAPDSTHLDAGDIAHYAAGTLEPARLVIVMRHVAACEACREHLAAGADVSARLASARTAISETGVHEASGHDHPEATELMALADGLLDAAAARALRAHVSDCATCAADLVDFEDARLELAPPVLGQTRAVAPWWQMAAAVAAIVAGGAAWWTMRQGASPGTPGAAVATGPSAPLAPAPAGSDAAASGTSAIGGTHTALRDLGGRLTRTEDGQVTGLDALPEADRVVVARLLTDGRLPGVDGRLLPPQGALMGTAPARAPFAVLTPVATAVDTPQPELRWTPAPGATVYRVAVYSTRLDLVAESGPLTGTAWTPAAPLPRGAVYLWQVEADTPAGVQRVPATGAPEARFRVLGEAERDSLRALETAEPRSHLALAARYATLGLRAEAARELARLAEANPGSPFAARLAREARAQAPSPTSTQGAP